VRRKNLKSEKRYRKNVAGEPCAGVGGATHTIKYIRGFMSVRWFPVKKGHYL